MIDHGPNCPSGWNTYENTDCWTNSGAQTVAPQPIQNLAAMRLVGTTTPTMDTVEIFTAHGQAVAVGSDSVLGLNAGWNQAEFNIFGDCCLSEAFFLNASSMIVARLTINDGTQNAPTCLNLFHRGQHLEIHI
jgi:hypothetical protein